MALTNIGMPKITAALVEAMKVGSVSVGVGNSSAAEDTSYTGLQGTSTFIKGIDTASLEAVDNVIKLSCTFSADEANFEWLEYGVFLDTVMLSRKPKNNGTKRDGQTWVINIELTLAAEPI